ncbi:MAG: hypothetical protein F4Z50_04870, partial [Gemmatimonadetes bacterium]|nr:hypothetical protein [Gemmatimonadota bacterium]
MAADTIPWRVLVLIGTIWLAACDDLTFPEPPALFEDRLVLIAVFNPDSTTHPVLVWSAEAGRPLNGIGAKLYRNGSTEGVAWELLDSTEDTTDLSVCGRRYGDLFSEPRCLVLTGQVHAGRSYLVEVTASGRSPARGSTGVVGGFQIESAALSGANASAVLNAGWTRSRGASHYLVSLRRYAESRLRDYQGWFVAVEETSISRDVPRQAIQAALEPLTLDVAAIDSNLFSYMTTGNGGGAFSIPPVQNVEGGFGVVGSMLLRSYQVDSAARAMGAGQEGDGPHDFSQGHTGNIVFTGSHREVAGAVVDPETGCYAVLRKSTPDPTLRVARIYADSALVFTRDAETTTEPGGTRIVVHSGSNRVSLHAVRRVSGEGCDGM